MIILQEKMCWQYVFNVRTMGGFLPKRFPKQIQTPAIWRLHLHVYKRITNTVGQTRDKRTQTPFVGPLTPLLALDPPGWSSDPLAGPPTSLALRTPSWPLDYPGWTSDSLTYFIKQIMQDILKNLSLEGPQADEWRVRKSPHYTGLGPLSGLLPRHF